MHNQLNYNTYFQLLTALLFTQPVRRSFSVGGLVPILFIGETTMIIKQRIFNLPKLCLNFPWVGTATKL